jgi:hypothetical protein
MKMHSTDPFDSIPPLFSGTVDGTRRHTLRTLMQSLIGFASFPVIGALASSELSAADDKLRTDPLANDKVHSWVKPNTAIAAPGKLPFVRVYTGPDGKTRVEQKNIELTSEKTPGLFIQKAETFAIRVIPPGTKFDWHAPSRRRIVTMIRGESTMTLRDGSTYKVTPGIVSLIENLNSDGHRGAFSETEYTLTMDVGLPLDPA